MSHEARINDALKQLGEEHRLGMVQPVEYRARRRMLIESWHEQEVTTSPGSLRAHGLGTIPPGQKTAIPAAAPAKNAPKLILAGVAVAAGIVVSGYFTFAPSKAPVETAPPATTAPPAPPASPEVLAARKAAEDFLLVNAWEQAPVEAMLEQWRRLSPGDRARAREEPALRTLRFKLDQNIQAEAQLVAPDARPEDRQRLDLLTRFAEELDA